MTISMDHKSNQKTRGSWDSKMSGASSWTSGGRRRGGVRGGSVLSCDSDIRFTRRKFSSQLRCACCAIATLLTFVLCAALAVYVAYTFYVYEPPNDQVFRGMFRVVEGDVYSPEMSDPATETFQNKSRNYTDKLDILFKNSGLKPGFVGTEVLALDGEDGRDLIVHFNLRFDPRIRQLEVPDLMTVFMEEIQQEESVYLSNITIDPSSLSIKKNDAPLTSPSPLLSQVMSTVPALTTVPTPPRKCQLVELDYCKHLPYNSTSYPNILGHKYLEEVKNDIISFRELVDAECYRKAYDFVCQLLQPACNFKRNEEEDEMTMPCRSFCRDFVSGCGSRLPEKIKKHLDCSRFPEYSGIGSCLPKPGCIQDMQLKAHSPRICDGVVDCEDMSDEVSCSYCPPGYLHCGLGRMCIPLHKRCDGKLDCPDHSDERYCLTIAPSIKEITKYQSATPHLSKYYSAGYVVFNEKGEYGKLCTENIPMDLNGTEDLTKNPLLQTAGLSLCKAMSFQSLDSITVEQDIEPNIPYVQMKNPPGDEIAFIRSQCPTKEVMLVTCSNLECGKQPIRTHSGIEGLSKMSSHGDWPWHVALYKEEVHLCDATLISPEWLATTASCFQGQPKAEWVAKFGLIRGGALSPWQQSRYITDIVNSPVEGSTIAIVKLDKPIRLSDFVRPVCLPKEDETGILLPNNMTVCNTLGWSKNREQLQRIQLTITPMDKCENISITTMNSLCTESTYTKDDCNSEEFAGSPMLCLKPNQEQWSLFGISNWRIACSKSGADRPRMYDKITSNIEWILKTISANTR